MCLDKSKDGSLSKQASDVVQIFFTDLGSNLEFVLSDIGSIMKVTTLLMNSKDSQISERSHGYLRRLITVFSQMFELKIEDSSREYMEDDARVSKLAIICKQFIEADKLLAVVLIPVLETLLRVTNKQRKDLESGTELALDILRGFSKEMKKPAWELVFRQVLDPFVTDSIKESQSLIRSGTSSKEDYFHKLLRCTLKDLYFMISEAKDKDIILNYMEFLQSKMATGDKV